VVERFEALGDQVLVRRERVVRQRFPVGEQADAELRREPRNFLAQALRVERGAAYDDDRSGGGREAGECQRIGGAVKLPEANA